jgi:hypothetical protein
VAPYPGTQLYEQAKALGYLRDDLNWEDFAIVGHARSPMELPNLSSRRIRELQIQMLREFYLRPRYILRKLGSVRNLAQLKSLLRGFRTLASLFLPSRESGDYRALTVRQRRHTRRLLEHVYADTAGEGATHEDRDASAQSACVAAGASGSSLGA